MIKICSPQLGISPISRLGGEVYDYQVLKGFTKKGFNVYVYLPKGRHYDKKLGNFYIKYSFIKHVFPPIAYSLLCLPYLFKTYQKEKFNILRVHSPRFIGLAAIIFHFFYPKVVILVSSVTVDDSKIFYWIERLTFNIAKSVIVQSEYMKKRVAKRFSVDLNKIFVTYGGMIEKHYKSITPSQAKLVKKNDKVILFMGSLIDRKNPQLALEVFIGVHKRINNSKLIIVGSGALESSLKAKVNENNLLDNVIFIKSAFEGEKAYWFSRMDVFLCPSKDEGFGMVVTEAMAFSKPVITSDQAAFKEIVDNEVNGYTISLNKKDQWVEKTAFLLENSKISIVMGKKAMKKVKDKFKWERMYSLNAEVVKGMIR